MMISYLRIRIFQYVLGFTNLAQLKKYIFFNAKEIIITLKSYMLIVIHKIIYMQNCEQD